MQQPLADGRTAAFVDAAYDSECLPSTKLIDALYSPGGGLSHDDRIRLQKLLDKCRVVEPAESDLCRPVRAADGPEREPSWGVAHALARAARGRAMSVLLTPYVSQPDWPSGWLTVTRLTEEGFDEVRAHVLRNPGDAPGFWRGLYTHERVPAERFFTFAQDAFPQLLFAASLRLNQFKGSYAEVLPWLVRLLGALDDHFARTLAECGGDQNQVMRRFKALDLDISPESPNTKKNASAWQQRNVGHEGATYRCEWHGKRLCGTAIECTSPCRFPSTTAGSWLGSSQSILGPEGGRVASLRQGDHAQIPLMRRRSGPEAGRPGAPEPSAP